MSDQDRMDSCPGCGCKQGEKKEVESNEESLERVHAPEIAEGFWHCRLY